MKVHEVIARGLADQGVDTLFGLMGEANMWVIDTLVREHGTSYVPVFREDAAVLAADAWGRVTGRVGVATVTHGPGLSNAVTALVEAVKRGSPLVVVTGDTARVDVHNLQSFDQRAVATAVGAGFQDLRAPDTALDDVATAFRRARIKRRPIVLNLPVDIQEAAVDSVEPTAVAPAQSPSATPDESQLDAAVGVLATARRPIVLAGRGAVDAGAREQVLDLARRLGAPVATTLLAKGWFHDQPHSLGVFGTFSTNLAGEVIGQADCVVALGASLNDFTAAHGPLLDGKRLVQVDIDPASIGRWRPADAAVVGDAKVVASTFGEWLAHLEHQPSGFADDTLAQRLAGWRPEDEFEDHSTADTIDMRTATIALNRILPQERTLVCDGGHFVMAPIQYFDVTDPMRFVWPVNFGSIGLGTGAAIGAATARPDTTTILALGDGGGMMNFLELRTAVARKLDLVAVVYNDGSYGAEYHNFARANADPELSLLDVPSFAGLAEGLGATGVTVRNPDELERVGKVVAERTGPVVIELMLDPSQRTGFFD